MFSHIFVLVCVFFWLTLKCQKRWGEWWVDLGQIWRKKHKWFSIYDWPWFLPTNTLKLEVRFEVAYLKTHSEACEHGKYIPIGSMYAIYGNIYHQSTPNVSIYTIHGSYGIYIYTADGYVSRQVTFGLVRESLWLFLGWCPGPWFKCVFFHRRYITNKDVVVSENEGITSQSF